MSCTDGASAVSTAVVDVAISGGIMDVESVGDAVIEGMSELVSREPGEDIVVEVKEDVISSGLVCSIVVDVVSVFVFPLVESVVGVGVGCSTAVVGVSALESDPWSSLLGSGCVSAPSGPRRKGVPALARK